MPCLRLLGNMKTLFDLSGKLALVTGSARGLGFEMAVGLASAGARVALNSRNKVRLNEAMKSLRSKGAEVYGTTFDVTSRSQVNKQIAVLERRVGPIDILVNNAGIQDRAPLAEMSEHQWRRVLDINLTGAFIVGQTVGKRMIKRGSGKIINICSLMSEVGRATVSNYAAAKGGLKMLTRSMAVEWASHNIQVNAIGPGYFRTEMTRRLYEDKRFDRWLRTRTPAGRWGEPCELSGAVIFLSSSASDYVNGQVIYVDGGLLASV